MCFAFDIVAAYVCIFFLACCHAEFILFDLSYFHRERLTLCVCAGGFVINIKLSYEL
jgi:hypothetical protein